MAPAETAWYFSPILFEIGPFKAHWYGLMYALTFALGYWYIHHAPFGKRLELSIQAKDELILSCIMGIILGGRLGYILLYNGTYYLANPLKIFALWEGGMSSHGALLGSILAVYWFCNRSQVGMLKVCDVIASYAPVGIILVRLGNFINGELYGRVAEKYCLYFPTDPTNCRYPSQLFQAFLEGFVLLIILQIVGAKTKKTGLITVLFFFLYGLFRILGEQFREPDPQIGYYFGLITQGQILSSLLIGASLILFVKLRERWYNKKISSITPEYEPSRKTHEALPKGRPSSSRGKKKKPERVQNKNGSKKNSERKVR